MTPTQKLTQVADELHRLGLRLLAQDVRHIVTELETQVSEDVKAAARGAAITEREECAKIAEESVPALKRWGAPREVIGALQETAQSIRARGVR